MKVNLVYIHELNHVTSKTWKLFMLTTFGIPKHLALSLNHLGLNVYACRTHGLALIFIDRQDIARELCSNDVERELWGNSLQRPVFWYVPGLTSMPWYDTKRLYDGESGQNLVYSHTGMEYVEFCQYIQKCGQTFTSIKLSAIKPGIHIPTNTGPSITTSPMSSSYRIHVGTGNKVIMFDDSWEHEFIHTRYEVCINLASTISSRTETSALTDLHIALIAQLDNYFVLLHVES